MKKILYMRVNALYDYNTIHQDDREQYYYRKVYAGMVKAVDLLCSIAPTGSTPSTSKPALSGFWSSC